MDMLESYDSDGNSLDATSTEKGDSEYNCTKQMKKNVSDFLSRGDSVCRDAVKINLGKECGSTGGGTENDHNLSRISKEIEDLDTANIGLSDNFTARVRSAYYMSRLNDISMSDEVTNGGCANDSTQGRELSLITDSSTVSSSVLAIEIGSRTTSDGILSLDGHDAGENLVCGTTRLNDKALQTMENKYSARMKDRLIEHTRNYEDMAMYNYPVDNPMRKSISTVTKSAIESYGKIGKNFMVLSAENVGGIYTTPSGMSEKTYYSDVSFNEELRRGDLQVSLENQDGIVFLKKRRRLPRDEMALDDISGPWIPFEEEAPAKFPKIPASDHEESKEDYIVPDKSGSKLSHRDLALAACTTEVALPLNEVSVTDGRQQTTFDGLVVSTYHKNIGKDYLGRSWVLPPKNIKPVDMDNYKAFLPKKEIHTYLGHTMAVQTIKYFPKTGHYLLSASMDGFIKIWDSNNNRKCVRTYKGHCKGVRDINFANSDGFKFYSCGFDSNIIQWDTEYGKVIGVYPIDKTPYCVTVSPSDENIFIVGSANKKACQFDARSGDIVLEYNEHLASVNTVTFIDNDRKIVTTSDDKKMFVWEYNIPVVIKHIADPTMHSMPAVVSHPSGKFILAQSMNNQIVVYESSGSRFKFFGRKRFKGHHSSGYAIKPTCSPDGRFVASGDSRGRVFLWDWKTCTNLQTLSGHKAVTMDCQWHPIQPSRLATCSWDGTIKLWD